MLYKIQCTLCNKTVTLSCQVWCCLRTTFWRNNIVCPTFPAAAAQISQLPSAAIFLLVDDWYCLWWNINTTNLTVRGWIVFWNSYFTLCCCNCFGSSYDFDPLSLWFWSFEFHKIFFCEFFLSRFVFGLGLLFLHWLHSEVFLRVVLARWTMSCPMGKDDKNHMNSYLTVQTIVA